MQFSGILMGIKSLMKTFERIEKAIGILCAIIRKKLAVGKKRGNTVEIFVYARLQFGMIREKCIDILARPFRIR
jgi:hypothetical protein